MGSTKNVLLPINILSNGNMSGTLISNVVNVPYLDNISVQFNFTGSPNGSFFVDVSLDNINWIELPISPALVTTSSPAGADINQTGFTYLRARYVPVSGTGTLNVILSGKSI